MKSFLKYVPIVETMATYKKEYFKCTKETDLQLVRAIAFQYTLPFRSPGFFDRLL